MRNLVILGLLKIISWLPSRIARSKGKICGWFLYSFNARPTQITRINLSLCYPNRCPSELESLCKKRMLDLGKAIFETPKVWRKGNPWITDKVVAIEGLDLFQDALQKDSGTILIIPHLGNWEVLGLWAGQFKPMTSLYDPPKMVVLDTMNFWMDIALDDLKKVISKVDVITINDEEARQLSGAYSLVNASKIIMEMGPKYVVIKKGEHGALIFHEDEMFFAPAMPLAEVFDPTGAGDTFAGGFTGYLAKTGDYSFESMKRAIIYGSCMASFCVEKFGTQRMEHLTKKEIDSRLQKFKSLTQYEIELS